MNLFKKINRVKRLVLSIIALGLCAFALNASAQLTPINITAATNLPPVVTSGASSNSLTSWIPIRQNSGMAFDFAFNASTGTGGVGYQIKPSIDGTNLSDTISWWVVTAANGTTVIHSTTNLSKDALAGYNYINVSAVTNNSGGTLTNKGLNASKWTAPLSY